MATEKWPLGPMVVPWNFDGDLALAYREACEAFADRYEWLGFLDCDVEIMSRSYATLALRAAQEHPEAGLISCRVNRQHAGQDTQSLGINADLDSRARLAIQARLKASFPGKTRVIGAGPRELISGCWFYVHIERALDCRAFGPYEPNEVSPRGAPPFFGVDQWAHEKLHDAGHPAVILDDLFVWHRYHNIERRKNRGHLGRVTPRAARGG